jgi:serine/threonine protein kinase/tetratricopeptide (TPR) repeat protein
MSEEEIFHQALTRRDPEERAAYLDRACGGDAALRASVEALLRANVGATDFMERTPPDPDATVDAPSGERPDTVIGPYKLMQEIGEGGFGVVYRAEQQQPLRRKVALKILKPGMDTRQVVARFEAERQALALMDHPNIARVLDGGATASGRPYFVMELVEGIPITDFCDRDYLTVRHRVEIFVAVCQAVQHAHQKGIIHRDLKPSNILVARQDDRPVVKVIDFGVAKAMGQKLTERTLFTHAAQIVGTPLYMSPEQADPTALDIDTRADIYALGVVLYELLTGTTPFDRERLGTLPLDEVRRIIREEQPVRPSARISTRRRKREDGRMGDEPTPGTHSAWRRLLPFSSFILHPSSFQELDWIVLKCLEKDRARRYETASGLARDVRRYLNDEPVEACPPSPAYRLQKFVRTHRRPLGVAAAFALILAAATIVSARQAIRATLAEGAVGLERDKAIAEKDRADKQVAIAQAVNDFLQKDLLGQADIANQAAGARDPNVTVRELLDRSGEGLEARFRGQPRIEAAIRLTIGRTYWAIGDFPKALVHLQRSLDLHGEAVGSDDPDTLETMHALAVVQTDRGDYDGAERLFERVLKARRDAFGADHPDTLKTLNHLGLVFISRGRYDQAEALLQSALDSRRARLGPDHIDTLESLQNVAVVREMRGQFDRAEPLHQEAIRGWQVRLGPDHPRTLTVMNNLAVLYHRSERLDEAERVLDQVLAIQRAKLGSDHPDTLTTLNNLALVYSSRGQENRAEPLLEQVLAVRRAKLDANHPAVLESMQNLATSYLRSGRLDAAEPLYKDALAAMRGKLGAEHPSTLIVMHNLGTLYRDRGRYREAEPLLREAVARAKATFGSSDPNTHTFIANFARLYEQESAPHLAEPLRRELVELRRKASGPESSAYANELGRLAQDLLDQKKFAEAEPLARESLALGEKNEPDHWATSYARTLVGGSFLGRGRYADAEPFLVPGYEGMKKREAKIPAHGKVYLVQALERLAQLYDAWGKEAEAARWRKVLEGEKSPKK